MKNLTEEFDQLVQLKDGWFYSFPSINEVEIRRDMLSDPGFKLRDPLAGGWTQKFFKALDGDETASQLLKIVPLSQREGISKILRYLKQHYFVSAQALKSTAPKWFSHLVAQKTSDIEEYYKVISSNRFCVVGDGVLARSIVEGLNEFDTKNTESVAIKSDEHYSAKKEETNLIKFPQETNQYAVELHDLKKFLIQKKYDFVIVAQDYFDKELIKLVNEYSIESKTRWLMSLVDGWRLYIGPTVFPGESGCFECLMNGNSGAKMSQVDFNLSGHLFRQLNIELINPSFAKIVAGFILSDMVNVLADIPTYLKRGESLTIARQTVINMETFEAEMFKVDRIPNCKACDLTQLKTGTES